MSKLSQLIQDINKAKKEELLAYGIPSAKNEVLAFSSPIPNYMLYGGLPRGRLIEFAGEESSGKTTTALDIVTNAQARFKQEWEQEIADLQALKSPSKKQAQRLQELMAGEPLRVFYADCENTLDSQWATLLGVDIQTMLIFKPMAESAEEIFEIVLKMIDTGEIGLVVIDSLGVLLSAQAYEKTMEERTYGGIAMALTLFSKKAEMACKRTGCTLIGINQMRDDMNSTYGRQITTGGKAWKHNCSVRLLFRKGMFIDEQGAELKRTSANPSGNIVEISIEKTKTCKPDRRLGSYTLRYRTGIDLLADLVELAITFGIVEQGGSWFSLIDISTGEVMTDQAGDTIKFQGKSKLLDYLATNPTVLHQVNELLTSKIQE